MIVTVIMIATLAVGDLRDCDHSTSILEPGDAVHVAIADLDGANGNDLVVENWWDDTISIFFNKGDGTFGDRVTTPAGDGPHSFVVVDLDGRPGLDLAVLNKDETVAALLNNGDGTFADPVTYATTQWTEDITAADFDGDLDADLAITAAFFDAVLVLLNEGDGTFAEAVWYPAGVQSRFVASADFDGDLDMDLVVTNYDDFEIRVLLNNGDGTFAAPVPYPVAIRFPEHIALGDPDGDGDVDVVVCTSVVAGDNVNILYNDGAAGFDEQVSWDTDSVFSMVMTDADDDGDDDLAIGLDYEVIVYLNDGTGNLSPDLSLEAGVFPTSLALGDLDADGNDVVATAHFDDELWVIRSHCPCPGDFDGDEDVGFGDLLQLLAAWGPCGSLCDEDLNDDLVVDFDDLLLLLAAWGPCL